jgi:prepilin-type N-terminal cleavage/methylation domain-containing protein
MGGNAMNASEGRRREAGYTLMEVSIALALVCLVVGTIATIYPALASAGVETRMFLLAQTENDRARLALIEDLQMTDSTRLDVSGEPYFKIVDYGAGTNNSVIFRKAIGFDVDVASDLVSTRFSTPVQYSIDATGNLIRTQDSSNRIVAQYMKNMRFSKSLEGAITVMLESNFSRGSEEKTVKTEIQIIPRNVLKV